jgi:sugar lactone lactonase YvrE
MQRVASGFGLLEGARWYPQYGLVFSDMTDGGLYSLVPDSEPILQIAYRKGIGGLVAHELGGFVVAGRNVAHKDVDTAGTPTSVLLDTGQDETFFNDLTADGLGRIFVGSVAHDPLKDEAAQTGVGRLYCIDLDRTVTVLAEDVMTSNGLGVDPDGSVLYHVDTGRNIVWSFSIDPSRPRSRQPFIDTSEYPGMPDGLTVDEGGSVWVAMAEGGVVVGWDAQGNRIEEIPVPQELVTSVTFGGEDMRTLFILTGPDQSGPEPTGGSVFTTRMEVAGLAAPYARVPIGQTSTGGSAH